jgi:hypothetical protein
MSAPSAMASFDTMLYDVAGHPHAPSNASAAATAAATVIAKRGSPPRAAAPTAAATATGQDSASASGQTQQSQGFMPYKWRQHPLPRGTHQLQPGGLFSLGKRSASASLAEPLRKRQASG